MTDQTAEALEPSDDAPVEDTVVETEDKDSESVDTAATDDAVDDTTETPEEPKKSRRDKRIDQLTGKNYALTEDRDYWRTKALERPQETPKPETVAEAPVAPKFADFDHDMEQYADALATFTQESVEFSKNQAVKEINQTATDSAEKQTKDDLQAERNDKFNVKQTDFIKDNPDYNDIVGNSSLAISNHMTDVILQLEQGPAVIYHLGKNPEIAYSIAQKTDVAATIALGQLQTKLGQKPPATETSNAPDPPETITGSRNKVEKDPADMTDNEYKKWRLKQIANR